MFSCVFLSSGAFLHIQMNVFGGCVLHIDVGPMKVFIVKDEFFSPENEGDLQKALGVVLDLLDYSSWRSNLDVWNHLLNIIKRLRMK